MATYFDAIIEICNLLTVIKFPKLAEIYPTVQKERAEEAVPLLTDDQIKIIKIFTVEKSSD